ncbi:MAG: TolC family protein [Balneola sp.]|nr:MAG: TolC family protein [Balneola sp.]
MKQISPSLFLSILLLLSALPMSTFGQTLEEYQEEAARNNPELRASFNEYQAALQKAPQVSSLPDPDLSFAYFVSPIETRLGPQRLRISATQMFPWFGSLKDHETKSVLNAKARFEVFQEQRNRIFHNMEVLWSELYTVQEQIHLVNENLEIVNTLVNTSLRKYETGLVPQVDVLRAQIEQEDLKTKIQLLEDNKRLLVIQFNELRNVDPSENINTPDTLSLHSFDSFNEEAWLEQVHSRNPNLNQLRYRESAAETSIEIAENVGRLSFGVGLDYIATGERDDVTSLTDNGKDAMVVRLNIKVPLFRKKYQAKVEEASLIHSAAQYNTMHLENQLETSFYTALRDLEDARRRYELYTEQQIYRVEQAVNVLLQSYVSDNLQFEEILRLERRLFSYQFERIKAEADEFRAFSYLRYLSGEQNTSPEDINY